MCSYHSISAQIVHEITIFSHFKLLIISITIVIKTLESEEEPVASLSEMLGKIKKDGDNVNLVAKWIQDHTVG